MGGSSQTQNSTQTTNGTNSGTSSTAPGWAPQVADLSRLFTDANGALTQGQGVNAPTDWASALSFLNPNSTVGSSGGALTSGGTNAATTGLTNLAGYNPAATNNTGALITAANQFMNGQNIKAQTDAATHGAMEQARDVINPGIVQHADATGNADSSRTGIAQGLVGRSLAENYDNTYNALSGQAFSNGLNLAENQAQSNNNSTLGALSQLISGGNASAGTGGGLVGSAITNTGNANNVGENSFANSVSNNFLPLSDYLSLIGSNNWGSNTNYSGTQSGTTTGTSNTESDPSAWSVIGGLLGAGGSMAGGLGKMGLTFSDRRIKSDIKRVGTLDNGLPVYLFRYKGADQIHMGLMAQDVEKVNPEAVVHIGDIKAVNYVKASA